MSPNSPPEAIAFRSSPLARYLKAMSQTRGDVMGAEAFARARGWYDTADVLKAATTALSDADVGAALAPVSNSLLEVLRPLTVVGRLQPFMRRVPFKTRVLAATVGGSGDWVEEGRPIPVTKIALEQTVQLEARKVGAIRVMTTELMTHAAFGSDVLVANDAAGSLVTALDTAFVDPANAGSDAKPKSISHGAPAFGSSGSSLAQIDADLRLLLNSLTSNEMALSTAAWVMSPRSATHLSLLRGSSGAPAFPGMTARGGTLMGLPVICSTSIAASGSPGEAYILLVEAGEVFIADDGGASIEVSTEAALEMNDAPIGGATSLVSLWEQRLIAIKAQRFLNWAPRKPGAVAVLLDVTY